MWYNCSHGVYDYVETPTLLVQGSAKKMFP